MSEGGHPETIDSLRGRFLSRMTDLERGMDANFYLFFGVPTEKELLFRSSCLAAVTLSRKISLIADILAYYGLLEDHRFSQIRRVLQRSNERRNMLAHGREVMEPLEHAEDGTYVVLAWPKKGHDGIMRIKIDDAFADLESAIQGMLDLLGETVKRDPTAMQRASSSVAKEP